MLEYIKQNENPNPLQRDGDEVVMLRGLFFVHLYGALEYTVTQGTQTLLTEISNLGVQFAHLEQQFYSLALDGRFKALKDASVERTWHKRTELLAHQVQNTACELNDTLFGNFLSNVWDKTIEDLFRVFCITQPVWPSPRLKGYLNEVTEKRNQVAHGRASPFEVGLQTRSPELEVRYDAINQLAVYVLQCYELHLASREFISQRHRAAYLPQQLGKP
jgi:hypothetical protein